jgi:hypothetical protein
MRSLLMVILQGIEQGIMMQAKMIVALLLTWWFLIRFLENVSKRKLKTRLLLSLVKKAVARYNSLNISMDH